jgi:hypothetical protein
VSWSESNVTDRKRVSTAVRTVTDSTNSDGSYTLCGVPAQVRGQLSATIADKRTGAVPISTEDPEEVFIRRTLFLATSASGAGPTAVLHGRVQDAAGRGIAGVQVQVEGASLTTTTATGDFTIAGLPVGTQTVAIRRPGSVPQRIAVDLHSREPSSIIVKLASSPVELATVTTIADIRRTALDHLGFTQRQKHNSGHFIDADQLAKMHSFHFTDLIQVVPSVRVDYDKFGNEVVRGRESGGSSLSETHECVDYVVDGVPRSSYSLYSQGGTRPPALETLEAGRVAQETQAMNASLRKEDIIGIEIYRGPETPAQFNRGAANCATIVVWTTASLSR